jgi:hypothetical protein
LHLTGVTIDGRLWHTIRIDPDWQIFGDVEGQAGERGSFLPAAIDGIFLP